MSHNQQGKSTGQKALQKVVSLALFAALVVWLAYFVWNHRGDMRQMFMLSPQLAAGMLLCALGACVVNCLYHLVLLQTYGFPLSLTDWMGVVSVSNCMAYVLPLRADLVFSAAYYQRVKGLKYTKSVSMAAGNIVFGVVFSLLQILVALVCIGIWDGEWPLGLWALLGLGTASMGVFIVISLEVQSRMPRFLRRFKLVMEVAEGFAALLKNRGMLVRLLFCLIGNNLFHLLLIMLSFHAMGQPVTLYVALFYNSVSWLSSIVAIVPGNIGIKEGAMGVAAHWMGALNTSGVAVSLLHRAALMAVYLLMGLLFALPVYRRFTRGQALSQGNKE